MRLKLIVGMTLLLIAPAVWAHCDWIDGPVVADARAALEKGDVAPLLKWVAAKDEAEIRAAFTRALAARANGTEAREVADQWFFETLVRVHRASEGEPFTGLKGAEYRPEPGIAMADHAVEHGALGELDAELGSAIRAEVRKRFTAMLAARAHAGESVAAGRAFVHAYAEFVHYVDNVHKLAQGAGAHETHAQPEHAH